MTAYEGAIVDVDGTLVRGDQLLPGTVEGLRALERAGVETLFFSNNPTRGAAHYAELLAPHGIDVPATSVLTSALVTAEYLERTNPEASIYLVGDQRLRTILERHGLTVTDDPEQGEVVLGSFDREFSYETVRESMAALADETPFYGTDPDATIPTDDGSEPGTGTILAAMEAASGREPDAILGKPSKVAREIALSRLETPPERTLVVGDRLDTDIELGTRAGMTTVLVQTGVSDRTSLEEASVEPEYVLESIGEIESVL